VLPALWPSLQLIWMGAGPVRRSGTGLEALAWLVG